MKLLYIFMSIPCFIQFSVYPQHQQHTKLQRSHSEPLIIENINHVQEDALQNFIEQNPRLGSSFSEINAILQPENTDALQSFIEQNPSLGSSFSEITAILQPDPVPSSDEKSAKLESEAKKSSSSQISRLTSKALALSTIYTLGLTAKYLYDAGIKYEPRFIDPVTILTSLSALKGAAVVTGGLTLIWLIQKGWVNQQKDRDKLIEDRFKERENTIKLKAEYEEKERDSSYKMKHAELLGKFKELKEELNAALKKTNQDTAQQIKEAEKTAQKKFEEFKKEIKKELDSSAKQIEEAKNLIDEMHNSLGNMNTTQEKLKSHTATIKAIIDDALRRYKKCLHIIANIPEKIIKQSERNELNQEVNGFMKSIDDLSTSHMEISITTSNLIPNSPTKRSLLNRLFNRKASASSRTHSRSNSFSQMQNINLAPTFNRMGTPPTQTQQQDSTIITPLSAPASTYHGRQGSPSPTLEQNSSNNNNTGSGS